MYKWYARVNLKGNFLYFNTKNFMKEFLDCSGIVTSLYVNVF